MHNIAPEIINEELYGAEVDCWSFGVIVYYCLSGELPFFDSTEEKLFERIKNCEWSFSASIFDDVSEEGKDLISKLLVKNPADRLTAAGIIAHPWFEKAS